nr:UreC [Streptomyces sp.]
MSRLWAIAAERRQGGNLDPHRTGVMIGSAVGAIGPGTEHRAVSDSGRLALGGRTYAVSHPYSCRMPAPRRQQGKGRDYRWPALGVAPHDLGVIGITSADAQGMGRAGGSVRRTFALAGRMKAELGPLDGTGSYGTERDGDDNERALRYISKLTTNPAVAHGLAHEVGSLDVGKLADIVLRWPSHFGATPQLVLKSGFPAYGVTGDPNASTDRCEPLVLGPQFGAYGATAADISVAFVAEAAVDNGDRFLTRRRRVAVRGTRGIGR